MELSLLGWDDSLRAALPEGLEPGRVALANRGICHLWTAAGEREARTARERPVTGDWVAFEEQTGRVRAVLPRRTCLARKKAGRACAPQALAANVDVLFIVMGLDGDFNLRRLERYLLLASESGASPVIVLNKSDLCGALAARARDIDSVSHAPLVAMSALDPASVHPLHRYVEPGRTAALLGSSGVGKSTIVNALLGELRQPAAAVRPHDSRGRHTTTARELFLLPQGWILMDTPGLRELEVWTDTQSVGAAFPDIERLAPACRFRDCRHAGEPGCAVAEAIDPARLANYRKLIRETDAQQRKRQARIAERAYRRFLRGET